MRYIKLFEGFSDDELLEEVSNLFIGFEDGYIVGDAAYRSIVVGRDDWTGNFQSSKVRNIYGSSFIDYHKDTLMSDGLKTWTAKKVIQINISKMAYINNLTDKKIVSHWKKADAEICKSIPSIESRANFSDLKLIGVVGKFFTLGKALHSDYIGRPYYGYDMMNDIWCFAFEYD